MPYAVSVGSGYWDPLSQPQTTTTYDPLGRVRVVTAPDGNSTKTSYPATPNGYSSYSEVRVENARGNVTRTLSDAWGRAKIVIPLNGINDGSPINPTVSYSYNALDQLESATRGGAMVDPSYDYAGRKVKQIDPDLGTWYYSYNGMGLITSQKDARCSGGSCVTINFQYDAIGRLTQKSYTIPGGLNVAATSTVNYSYDAGTNGIGQRTAMSDGSGSITWSYDVRGRVTQESKVISGSGTFVTQYTYNTADLPATMRYPADNAGGLGETVTFTYRPQGLINSVIGTSTTVKSTTYTAAGQVDVRELGDNSGSAVLKTDYDYFLWNTLNGQGRLKRILTQDLSPLTTLQDLRYYSGTDTSRYDEVGNLLNIYDYVTGSPQTQTFSYDNLDRLHTAQAAGGAGGNGDYAAETYDYSASSGNLSSKTGVGSYTYLAQSSGCAEGALPARPHAVTTAGTTTYCYDQDGNMTRRDPSGGAVYNFQYDAENRLVSASGSATASFVYDGDGVRVKGTVGGVTTAYIGSHFEWTGSTGTMLKYYYAGGARVAMRQGSTLYFLLTDHLGSTHKMANADGSNYTTHLYKAWGEKRYPSGASGLLTTYRYTGQREQVEIGLYFYGARWWDSYLDHCILSDAPLLRMTI